MRNSKEKDNPKYDLLWFLLYFIVPCIGIMSLTGFFEDQEHTSRFLRQGHLIAVGVVSALVWVMMLHFTRGKTIQHRVIAGVLLFIAFVLINLVVRSHSQ